MQLSRLLPSAYNQIMQTVYWRPTAFCFVFKVIALTMNVLTLYCVALFYWILCCAVLYGTLYCFQAENFHFQCRFSDLNIWSQFGFALQHSPKNVWCTDGFCIHTHTHTRYTRDMARERKRKKMWYSGLRNLFIVLASMHCCWCICVAYEHKWSVRVLRWWFNELCTLKSVFILFFFQNRLSLSSHQPFCFINCFLIFSFFYSHSKSLRL